MSSAEKHIVFNVEWVESTLYDVEGKRYDERADREPNMSQDFTSFAEAREWARASAVHDKIEVVTDTRYGNGAVTRNVYEIAAFTEDEDGETVLCSYDGVPLDTSDTGYQSVDVLALHPEVLSAWRRANSSFCSWLDYEDMGEGFESFDSALADLLGEKWTELDFISRL